MHVFLDDSGDAGMKLGQGSSAFLVMAACVFTEPDRMEQASGAIRSLRRELGRGERWEFKYNGTSASMKDEFFRIVPAMAFSLRAIVIDKSRLTSGHLRGVPNDLKAYAVRQLLTHTFGTVTDAKLVIDGQDRAAFGRASETYFRQKINQQAAGTIRKVVFEDSVRNPLIQLADMAAGALNRSARTGGQEASDHLRVLRAKARQPAGSIWYFPGE